MPSTASTSLLDAPSNTSSSLWKTAKDPASGREYYYHVETRQTQWRKPLELATADERKTLMEKDQQQRAFFQAMEKNILQGLAATNTPPVTAKNTSESAFANEKELAPAAAAEMKIPASIARPGAMRVRTISTMDVMVLKDLIETLPSNNSSKPHGSRSQRHGSAFSNEGGSSGAFNSRSSLISIVEDSQDGDTDLEYSEELHKSQAIVQEFFQTLQDEECDGSSNGSDGDNNIDATAASDSHYNEQDPSESEFTVDADADNVRTKYMTEQTRPRRPHALSRDSIASSDSASTTSLSISALALGSDRNLSMSGSMSDASGILSEDGLGLLDEEEIMALRQLATAANQMLHLGDEEEEDTNFDLDEDDSLQGLHITSAASAPTPDTMTRDSLSLTDTSDYVGDRNVNGDALVASTSSATSLPSLPKPSSLAGDLPTRFPARPNMMRQRRNTCGTIYVSSTLSDPDKDATITCVCAVYRTHVLQSAMESATSNGSDGDADDYLMFNDLTVLQRRTDRVQFKNELPTEPPTLDEISSFYRAVFRRAKMEADCIIMSLIYVERLIKKTNGKLRPRPENWRSILFACMVLSSKVWDDLSMWNADFSQTCPAGIRFPLQRINQLEIAVLGCLEYNVKVKAGEYAKYYFLLRTMLIKSGLGGHDLDSMLPLDVEGAKRLQQVSTQYQTSHLPKPSSYRSRSVGMLSASMTLLSPGQGLDAKSFPKAGLEQLVKM
ncbi:hypothetical protein MPSEU_001089000 [Mayamaea pseudoterrestris]|nr:hypothetical protein MPSEU_001089000 [Mayamaea pseudoterrestris]